MFSSVHPFFIIAACSLVGTLLSAALGIRASTIGRRVIFVFLALAFASPAGWLYTVIHPELVDARFRTYKAFYGDLHEGMTRPEIDALLVRHYPDSGPRQRPKVVNDQPESLGFFMNPETSLEPNCEGIFLTLHDGRLTRKDYSPD